MKVICVIPSYNEEKTIAWLVREAKELGHDVLVVDDGSRDRTAALARSAGAEVLENERNMGKGASLRNAFRHIRDREADIVVVMDGDGQHLPRDIARLIEGIVKDGADIVVGNRMGRAKGMPFVRWATNTFMSGLLSLLCRRMIPDTQCGFRALRMEALKNLMLKTENFEIESEMLLEGSRRGLRIRSAPVTTVYEGQHSSIHPWRDTLRFFRFLFAKR
ncbi:MAG: glycosyltransferase family 2 protein [Deltaproteobacteria bacterium]